jgi:hypothetical protein
MRVFFGHLTDERTGREVVAVSYFDRDAKVNAIEFPPETVKDLVDMCDGMGRLLGAMLQWHKMRLQVSQSRGRKFVSPVFGQSVDAQRQMGETFFPSLSDLKKEFVAKGEQIAIRKSEEISKLPRGHVIAIDIDAEEILPLHGVDLRDVIWQAMRSHPSARLVFRRITSNGKVGPY